LFQGLISSNIYGAADFIIRTEDLPVEEMAHGLSLFEFEPRAFRPIANNQFPTNPLIIRTAIGHREIFKVRNPIRNFHDKLVDILYRALSIQFKDSEMNQAGE
jgi:hypothetical protein